MGNLRFYQIGIIYAGCFLGAGFVSGQELWQFFGVFGKPGLVGLFISLVLLALFGAAILRLVQKTGNSEMDKLIVSADIPPLRFASGAIQLFVMFGVLVIMIAGIGALANQLFGLPSQAVSFVFASLVFALSVFGLDGILRVFTLSVPLIIVFTVIFCIASVKNYGFSFPALDIPCEKSVLLPNFVISAVTYAAYNLIATIGIISPFGEHIKKKSTVWSGIIFGTSALGVIAYCIVFSVATDIGCVSAQLPMLKLATDISRPLGVIYGFLLLVGMFGTALSSTGGITNYICKKSKEVKDKIIPASALICAVAFIASLFGFGNLVGSIYPFFGYMSFAFLGMIIYNLIKTGKKVK